jgi:uncharacterized protein YhhL (DUF1145 family)
LSKSMTSLLTRIYPAGMHLRYLHGTFGANRAIAIRVIVIIFGIFIYLRYAKKIPYCNQLTIFLIRLQLMSELNN